jgi:hypothetical protein
MGAHPQEGKRLPNSAQQKFWPVLLLQKVNGGLQLRFQSLYLGFG